LRNSLSKAFFQIEAKPSEERRRREKMGRK